MEKIDQKNISFSLRVGYLNKECPTITCRHYYDYTHYLYSVIKELSYLKSMSDVINFLRKDVCMKEFDGEADAMYSFPGSEEMFLSKDINKPKNIDGFTQYVRYVFLFVKNDNEETVSCNHFTYIYQ